MADDTQFQDVDSYAGGFDKDKITFKLIVLMHLKQIGHYASCEFRGGYWEEKPHPNIHCNATIRTYVPDTREVYSNSVEYLADILYPYFDEEMSKAFKKAEEDTDKAYNDNTIVKQPDREDESEEETEEYERKFKDLNDRISYRSERVKINRKLFRALCCFLFRKKYLELGTIED